MRNASILWLSVAAADDAEAVAEEEEGLDMSTDAFLSAAELAAATSLNLPSFVVSSIPF